MFGNESPLTSHVQRVLISHLFLGTGRSILTSTNVLQRILPFGTLCNGIPLPTTVTILRFPFWRRWRFRSTRPRRSYFYSLSFWMTAVLLGHIDLQSLCMHLSSYYSFKSSSLLTWVQTAKLVISNSLLIIPCFFVWLQRIQWFHLWSLTTGFPILFLSPHIPLRLCLTQLISTVIGDIIPCNKSTNYCPRILFVLYRGERQ